MAVRSWPREDILILQSLSARVAALAARPCEKEKAALWTAHNDLETDRPVVFIDPENGWNEIIPPSSLACTDPQARGYEMMLRKLIHWAEVLGDDKVIPDTVDIPYVYTDTGWGLEIHRRQGDMPGGSYRIQSAIEDYASDFDKVRFPRLVIDGEASDALMENAVRAFGGHLRVRRHMNWWWTLGMTSEYINLRNLEELLCDFVMEPQWVHRMMGLLRDGTLQRIDGLEAQGLLFRNTGADYVGSGGFGLTKALPGPEAAGKVTTAQMWGFAESQETNTISPAMFAEFVFPYQLPILERFGLNCYGCCEPLDARWETVRQVPRLRRVSVSAWANWEKMRDQLAGKYVASVKPNPAYLATPVMAEKEVRGDLRRALEAFRGQPLELIMKDNHSLGGNPDNAARWVRIAREEIDRAG